MALDRTDMASSDAPEAQGWQRTFNQMYEGWFKPEIERRREAETLPANFDLYMAQALFPPEGQTRILLNDEVRGEALLRAPRPVTKGDSVLLSDLEYIETFELPDELLDNGHFTIIRAGQRWGMFFNFLSGRAKAKDMFELASEYLAASISSAAKGHDGPAVDNLFSATELASKAELILHRSRAGTAKKHKAVASSINAWAKLGNIDVAFVALFNRLGRQRPNARYGDKARRPPAPDQDDFDLVQAVIERGFQRVSKATERNSGESGESPGTG